LNTWANGNKVVFKKSSVSVVQHAKKQGFLKTPALFTFTTIHPHPKAPYKT
jgi:hypothetical protein